MPLVSFLHCTMMMPHHLEEKHFVSLSWPSGQKDDSSRSSVLLFLWQEWLVSIANTRKLIRTYRVDPFSGFLQVQRKRLVFDSWCLTQAKNLAGQCVALTPGQKTCYCAHPSINLCSLLVSFVWCVWDSLVITKLNEFCFWTLEAWTWVIWFQAKVGRQLATVENIKLIHKEFQKRAKCFLCADTCCSRKQKLIST